MIHMPGCDSADTAFSITAELQDISDNFDITVRGVEVKVGLEPDKERKAVLTTHFNTARASEAA